MKSISSTTLLKLYQEMLKIRKLQLKIEAEYHKDEMKTPVHLCIGQEAISSGVCANLKKDDYLFSNHRSHGHYIAKGGDVKKLVAELYCKETGCSKGRGGSMHLIATKVGHMGSSAIVAGSIPIATGAALSSVLKKDGKVSVVFFGDAATEEGVFFESMNFATLKKLPIVYVCENNFYSVCSHQSAREANPDISMRGKAFDIPAYQIDGSDVCEVYLKSREAINCARRGRGPVLLECRAYRFRAHAGAGDPHKDTYRNINEWKEWIRKDPLKSLERKLLKNNILTKEKKSKISKTIDKELTEAFKFAKESILPNKKDLKKYLFR
ncbi:MAG: thiamine pyrophosphate-dependent dehydrogenase E1 component subunit alpha [Candidatus Saelkia tenebricola]|nr:thiamine pyrophosphate-dependent dehydrogenase E1 component subunit alpha [Candidatus Saelkia tenebricola]